VREGRESKGYREKGNEEAREKGNVGDAENGMEEKRQSITSGDRHPLLAIISQFFSGNYDLRINL